MRLSSKNPLLSSLSAVMLVALLAGDEARADLLPEAASAQAQNSVTYNASAQRYELVSQGDHRVTYSVTVTDSDIQQGMLLVTASVDRGPVHVVLAKAGTRYRDASGGIHQPEDYEPTAGAVLQGHRIDGESVVLEFTEHPGAHSLDKTYRLSLVGQSLKIEFSSTATWGRDGYAGLSLGHMESESGAKVVDLPLLPIPLVLLSDGTVLSAYLDPTVSHSSDMVFLRGVDGAGNVFAHSVSTIAPDTAGNCQALQETAYVTLAEDMAEVFPVPERGPSQYRSSLSGRLVLDVWGLHHSIGVPEGVGYEWTAQETGTAHITLHASDANGACGDGVVVELLHSEQLLARLVIPNGTSDDQVWTGDVGLLRGEKVFVAVARRGNNACDATTLRLTIELNGQTYDSVDDFSSVQGQRGWSYLEFQEDQRMPMTWDPDDSRWNGSTAYSILWQGGAHPGQGATSFLDAENMVRRYAEYGMNHLAIIFHVWQRWGYDAGLPSHYPANPSMGTEQDMADFVATAKDAGMLVALHENYTDMYPDDPPDHPSPLWDAGAVALDPSGNWKLGWLNESTGQQAFRIAVDRMEGFAVQQGALISGAYAPNATYLDVTPGWNPAMSLDYDASKNVTPTLAHAYERTVSLFDAMRSAYQGPLFGEGGEGYRRWDTFFAGSVDGVERQIEGRMSCMVAPDYELSVVKPRMLNHGMGYYARYFSDEPHALPSVEELDLDQYRATEIAYGHAGFLGDGVLGSPSWLDLHVPEYWLLQALQDNYADASVTDVSYWDGSNFVDLKTALASRLPLERAKVRISYDNGLTIWVNRDQARHRSSSVHSFSHEQGHGGWSYFEDLGSGLVPMHWDPARERWQGSGIYSFQTKWAAHPQGGAAVRVFVAPDNGSYHMTGSFEDADQSCGDGVALAVVAGSTTLWQCSLPEDGACSFDLSAALRAGDRVQFRIDQRTNNNCDSTLFSARVEWTDNANHDWSINGPNGPVLLPPSGFYAHSPSLEAKTVRTSLSADAPIADRVSCHDYEFTRSRGGLQDIDGITTDGAITLVHGILGDDIHGLALTQASSTDPSSHLIVEASQRCDINLNLLDSHSALLTVRRLADPTNQVDVTIGQLPDNWKNALTSNQEALSVAKADSSGDIIDAFSTLTPDQDGNIPIPALEGDQPYLLQIDLSCQGPDCCGNGVCNSNEDCSTCPQDCPVGPDQVCCDGTIYEGECCTDDDCAPYGCMDHQCVHPACDVFFQYEDAGTGQDEPPGGCNCRVARSDSAPDGAGTIPAGPLPWLLALFVVLVVKMRRRS